jgi:hypothetical protein
MSDSQFKYSLDRIEILKKVFKYLIIGLIVALSTKYIPSKKLKTKEIIMISIIAAITFAILDLYTPSALYNNDQ